MPRGDGTGPWGLGPMTGRGLGYCAGFRTPGYVNPGPGFGPRWGWPGWGRRPGLGRWRTWRALWGAAPFAWSYWPPRGVYPFYYGSSTDEEVLRREAEMLKEEMEALQGRLAEVESALKTRRGRASGQDEEEEAPGRDSEAR